MACGKKHKPFILKHKAHISKYVPCVFCLFKFLINSNLQDLPKIIYLFGFQTFAENCTEHCLNEYLCTLALSAVHEFVNLFRVGRS